MKSILLFALITLISCQEGGWTKRSLAENSIYIDRSFREAYKSYKNADYDGYIRLSIYSQIVSGTNYKVCFLDPNADYPIIQEFVVYVPLPTGKRNGPEFNIIRHKEYEVENLISHNDAVFSEVEKYMIKGLENTNEKVKNISYVFSAENNETTFFMVFADTENGEHQYVFSQDKSSKEFDYINKIR